MFNLYGKLSAKKIILYSILLILMMGGVVVLYAFDLINETVFTVGLFVLLMIFSTLTSSLLQRKLQKKMENKKKGEPYHFVGKISFENPLKSIKANYGNVELYLEDKVLYSLVKVNDCDTFFDDDQQQIKFNIDKKKYDKMIQFYIFDVKDYHLFRKISIINYQAQNFYVASFMSDGVNKIIYQTDYVKPNDDYEEVYHNFIKLLKLTK